MFNKKHLDLLASTIKEQRTLNGRSVYQMEYDNAIEKYAELLANKLAESTPRFDKARFLQVCLG